MSGEPTVVICDCNLDLTRILQQRLTSQGLKVRIARTGRAALRLVDQGDVAVVVLDLKMKPMDGIETAASIESRHRDVRIVISTAFDSPEYRRRAAAKNLRIERWVDKDDHWLENVGHAVCDALGGNLVVELQRRIGEAAKKAGISAQQRERFKEHLDLSSLVLPPPLAIVSSSRSNGAPKKRPRLRFEELVRSLQYYLAETSEGFLDPARRDINWDRFRELVKTHLWEAISRSTDHEYRRQLAVQLKQAVQGLAARVLAPQHLDAARLSLERLGSPNVGPHDVVDCKNAWRRAKVETLPSLRKALKEWEDLYHVEGPED